MVRWLERILLVGGAVLLAWWGIDHLRRDARTDRLEERVERMLSEADLPTGVGTGEPSAASRLPADLGGNPVAPPAPAGRDDDGDEPRLLGRLEIPDAGISTVVVHGIDDRALDLGAGFFPETSPPELTGNTCLAGHRDTVFRGLRKVEPGQEVVLRTPAGIHTYVVESTRVVEPEDVWVLAPSTDRRLTLVTCYPFDWVGPAPRRFVVHARATGGDPSSPPPITGRR